MSQFEDFLETRPTEFMAFVFWWSIAAPCFAMWIHLSPYELLSFECLAVLGSMVVPQWYFIARTYEIYRIDKVENQYAFTPRKMKK